MPTHLRRSELSPRLVLLTGMSNTSRTRNHPDPCSVHPFFLSCTIRRLTCKYTHVHNDGSRTSVNAVTALSTIGDLIFRNGWASTPAVSASTGSISTLHLNSSRDESCLIALAVSRSVPSAAIIRLSAPNEDDCPSCERDFARALVICPTPLQKNLSMSRQLSFELSLNAVSEQSTSW